MMEGPVHRGDFDLVVNYWKEKVEFKAEELATANAELARQQYAARSADDISAEMHNSCNSCNQSRNSGRRKAMNTAQGGGWMAIGPRGGPRGGTDGGAPAPRGGQIPERIDMLRTAVADMEAHVASLIERLDGGLRPVNPAPEALGTMKHTEELVQIASLIEDQVEKIIALNRILQSLLGRLEL